MDFTVWRVPFDNDGWRTQLLEYVEQYLPPSGVICSWSKENRFDDSYTLQAGRDAVRFELRVGSSGRRRLRISSLKEVKTFRQTKSGSFNLDSIGPYVVGLVERARSARAEEQRRQRLVRSAEGRIKRLLQRPPIDGVQLSPSLTDPGKIYMYIEAASEDLIRHVLDALETHGPRKAPAEAQGLWNQLKNDEEL